MLSAVSKAWKRLLVGPTDPDLEGPRSSALEV